MHNMNDNLCVWRCLVNSKRIKHNRPRPAEGTMRDTLYLAREFYEQPNLRVSDFRLTKLIDFEHITLRFQVNIRLYESVNNL